MKTIKILGTGCPKCKQTEAIVRKAVADLGADADIQKVEDIQDIMQYNILSTPAVVIDEVVQIKGRVPKAAELEALLKA
ncbi:thioredoxin family protein [Phaeodactylibacter xiamenensis]|jgi:small redox-active disulfide protein 2|uniref:thioredoxin family protein n=1 Tax=Phaeodactylibacter xiamenensis TaxID=1524460 RepID=UPI0024A8094B|nr:thioredoxin family protein [Phaeodactylibacter xiamenensis]